MDPNAALQNIRDEIMNQHDLADNDLDPDPYGLDRLMDSMEALDRWLSKGGFPPKAWQTLDRK